jgi:hypothetical protein
MTGVIAGILICVVVALVVVGWGTMMRNSRAATKPGDGTVDASTNAAPGVEDTPR